MPPETVSRFPTADHALRAGELLHRSDALAPGFSGIVRMDGANRSVHPALIRRDYSGGFNTHRFFSSPKRQVTDICILPDGWFGLQAEDDSRFIPNMSIADRDGRPLVDEPLDRQTAFHAKLEARGLLRHEAGSTEITLPAPALTVAGTVFATAAYDNYFHWHNDVLTHLPYLFEIQARTGSGPIRLLSTWPATDWRLRSLALMGLGADAYVQIRRGEPVRADGLLVALRRPGIQIPTRGGEAFARIRDGLGISASGVRRLYISRADSRVRRITNEDALRGPLERLGFTFVSLAELPYDEKVRLFASASVCVGPHGAGFSHIGYMAEGSRVVEMLTAGPKWEMRPFIPRMTAVFGHRYGLIVYPKAEEPGLDFAVDPRQLVADIEAALDAP